MNFKNLFLSTLACGAMLSVSTKNDIAVSELSNNLKSTHQKPFKAEHNLTYKKVINHKISGDRIVSWFSIQDKKGYRVELETLASELGYDHFNWVSYVESDPYGIEDSNGNVMSAPYNDPPVGGYQYDSADQLPFYWDVSNCNNCNQRHHIQNRQNLQQFKLAFKDAPRDNRLQPGESIEFITSLVGVKSIDQDYQGAEWDVLHTFRWKTTRISNGDFQVSIVDNYVDAAELSPFLMAKMILDGAELSNTIKVSSSN